MKSVELFRPAGRMTWKVQDVIGRVELSGGKVQFVELPPKLVRILKEEGIMRKPPRRKLVFPKDGLIFLESLQFGFSRSIIRASEVKE